MKMTYREAIREALRDALRTDPRVFMIGLDIGKYGGTYAVTRGLLDEFGPDRIRDAPLSESAFVGTGIGAALNGLRPIVEIMTINFSLLALDQIMNGAATLRHMSGGQVEVPLVVRMATGAGRQLAAQHSHSLENWYAHIPGLRVLAPATVSDARRMLAGALRERDPVVICEHVQLYGTEDEVVDDDALVDLDHAVLRRSGNDATIITYGGSLPRSLAAADSLAADGISVDLIDLRTLRPLDVDALVASVSRTHRAVVVDEGWRTGSLAGEIAAILGERAFWELDAPVGRVCTAEVPIPYAKHLELAALPSSAAIVQAVKAVMHA